MHTNHPRLHPSGPRHSSVKSTIWKSVFRYCRAHFSRLIVCLANNGGRITGLITLAMLCKYLHLDVCATSEIPASSNIRSLDDKGFLAATRLSFNSCHLILVISRRVYNVSTPLAFI